MISFLRGIVIDKDLSHLILDVGGVGYKVGVTLDTLNKFSISDEAEVWTYLAVRENSMDLYGFGDKEEMDLFELLLTISGVGPKSAISILSSASVATIKEGVASDDPAYFSKVSGIGKKSAEKIIIGLKDKLDLIGVEGVGVQNGNAVAIDALAALGYSEREARDVISKVKSDNPEEMIREALKIISEK